MSNRIFAVAAATVLALVVTQDASAQATNTATTTVTYEITAINEIAFSGNPAKLSIGSVAELAGVSDDLTTWSITTNQPNTVVSAAIDADMPADVTLTVALVAPAIGESMGAQILSNGASQDLVTGIGAQAEGGMAVTYELSALSTAGVLAEDTRTVTFTITGGV